MQQFNSDNARIAPHWHNIAKIQNKLRKLTSEVLKKSEKVLMRGCSERVCECFNLYIWNLTNISDNLNKSLRVWQSFWRSADFWSWCSILGTGSTLDFNCYKCLAFLFELRGRAWPHSYGDLAHHNMVTTSLVPWHVSTCRLEQQTLETLFSL